MSGSNYAQVSYYHNGNERTIGVWDGGASIDMPVDVDENSPYSYTSTSTGSVVDERFYAPSGRSGTITGPKTVTVDYYQQYKPTITLSGTDSSHAVNIETRTLYGAPAAQSGIYNSPWSDWCDVGSTLTFSESTTGIPSRSTKRIVFKCKLLQHIIGGQYV